MIVVCGYPVSSTGYPLVGELMQSVILFLISMLGADEFQLREIVSDVLTIVLEISDEAGPVRDAATCHPDPEIRVRCERILERYESFNPPTWLTMGSLGSESYVWTSGKNDARIRWFDPDKYAHHFHEANKHIQGRDTLEYYNRLVHECGLPPWKCRMLFRTVRRVEANHPFKFRTDTTDWPILTINKVADVMRNR